MAQTVEKNLESSYQEYLAAKVSVVLSAKQHLRTMAMDARNDLYALEKILEPSVARNRLQKLLLDNHADEQSSMVDTNYAIHLATLKELLWVGIPELHVSAQMNSWPFTASMASTTRPMH